MKYRLLYAIMIICLFLTAGLPDSRSSAAGLLWDGPASDPTKLYLPLVIQSGGINQLPNLPASPSPSNGATAQSLTSTLSWTGGDPNGDTVVYDIYFGTANPPVTKVADQQSALTYNPGTLTVTTTYYWKITARDEHALATEGPIWSFTTGDGGVVTNDMLLIPAGSFSMGTTWPAGMSDEKPLHTVTLDAYRIDRTEVTNAKYALCVAAGGCTVPGNTENYDKPTYASHPVVWVNYTQARDYCGWDGKRLPTEAEWEKAARGSSDTRPYPWGEQAPTCALGNFRFESNTGIVYCGFGTRPVGSYPTGASPYGALDMGGNVYEWVSDWYQSDYYAISPVSNPQGPVTGTQHILRGGSWAERTEMSVTSRGIWGPATRSNSWGFRCAAAP